MFDLSFGKVQRGATAIKTREILNNFGRHIWYKVCNDVTFLQPIMGAKAEGHAPRNFVRRVRRHFGIFSALLRVFN